MKYVSSCSQDGQTPLHMAASGRLDGDLEGRLACIALLLSYKANMELPDKVLLPSFIHPSIHACMHSFMHSSVHPSIHAFVYSLFQSFVRPFIHSFIHLFIHLCSHKSSPRVGPEQLLSNHSAHVGIQWLYLALHLYQCAW